MSYHKRIKRLEEQVEPPPDPETRIAEREAHREALERLYQRCLEDPDPGPRTAAVDDLADWLRSRGQL